MANTKYTQAFNKGYIAARTFYLGEPTHIMPVNPYKTRREKIAWDAGWKYGKEG